LYCIIGDGKTGHVHQGGQNQNTEIILGIGMKTAKKTDILFKYWLAPSCYAKMYTAKNAA